MHARRSLVQPWPEAEIINRLEAAVDRLENPVGRAVSANNMFYAEMYSKIKKGMRDLGHKRGGQQVSLRKCQQKWIALHTAQKTVYVDRAKRVTEVRKKILKEDVHDAEAHPKLATERAAALREQQGVRKNMAECRFSEAPSGPCWMG